MDEAARLRAIAEHGQGLAGQRLASKPREHHPVGCGLAGADGVEKPGDDHLGAQLAVVPVGEHLAEGLGVRIVPARLRRGAEEAVGLLVKRTVAVLSVDLGGRGEEERHSLARRGPQHGVASTDVSQQRLERPLADELHPDGGGEVKTAIDPPHELAHQSLLGGRSLDQSGSAGLEQVGDVLAPACAQVIEDDHLVAARDECVCEMRADEPSPARYQVDQTGPRYLSGVPQGDSHPIGSVSGFATGRANLNPLFTAYC